MIPRVFVSYSHDSEAHKAWVLALADRLVRNGVDVILDRWDTRLGSDLPLFMEGGLGDAERVLAVCSENFVDKANGRDGGVGYEARIITAQLMTDVPDNRVVPVIRNNSRQTVVPTFLSSRLYIDFRDDEKYELRYAELLHDLHGKAIIARPPLGESPFANDTNTDEGSDLVAQGYVSPSLSGTVTFDYSNNNGLYRFGSGDLSFGTKWSTGGGSAIHAYNDDASISWIALAPKKKLTQIEGVSEYDHSSRARLAQVGDSVIWKNTSGYFLATAIADVKARGYGWEGYSVIISYKILAGKQEKFSGAI